MKDAVPHFSQLIDDGMTQTSAVVQKVKDESPGQELRFKSIPCGLKKVLRCGDLQEVFKEHSRRIGVYRHLVSVVANGFFIRHPDTEVKDWFAFYGQLWGTIEKEFGISNRKVHPEYQSFVRGFFERHPPNENTKELLSRTVPVMIRQQECKAMETSTLLHLSSFPSRLRRYTAASLVLMANGTKVPKPLIGATADAILCRGEERASCNEKIKKHLGNMDADKVSKFVDIERQSLGDILGESKQDPHWESTMSNKKMRYRLIPHLLRISSRQTDMLQTSNEDDDECDDEDEDEEEDVPFETCEPCHTGTAVKTWDRSTRPRPFSILPICKLKNAMVYYGWTEMKEFYSALRSNYRKRKREEEDEKTPFVPDKVDFAAMLFDLRKGKIKGVGGVLPTGSPKWRLSMFRTDGEHCVLTFASGGAPNLPGVAELPHSGYKDVPLLPAAMTDVRGTRGLYKLTQKNPSFSADLQSLKITAVDPGQCKPIQMATISGSALPDPIEIASRATLTYMGSAEWKTKSGRNDFEWREQERRRKNESYAAALKRFSKCRRKCADETSWAAYVTVIMETLNVRCEELLSNHRSYHGFRRSRCLQKHLSRVADAIFGCSSLKKRKNISPALTSEERQDLLKRLHDARVTRKEACGTHVVFFGDGTFGHMKGNAPVPKKKLLHQLAVRGLTILIDEYNTSKFCPCGRELMTNPFSKKATETKRVRVHKTAGDDSCAILKYKEDRDELATINMLLSALSVLNGKGWPRHLSRGA